MLKGLTPSGTEDLTLKGLIIIFNMLRLSMYYFSGSKRSIFSL